MNRDKVLGMIVGGAIGDALGMPVETWDSEKIFSYYPTGIHAYHQPKNHKWFSDDVESGTITDDTQLTVATIKGIIAGYGESKKQGTIEPCLREIAKEHIKAADETMDGWGKTTRESVARLKDGMSIFESGKSSNVQRGTGNGVPMKASPLGVLRASLHGTRIDPKFNQRVVDYSAMTHYSKLSAHAAVLHVNVIEKLLWDHFNHFNPKSFSAFIGDEFWFYENLDSEKGYNVSHLNDSRDQMKNRMTLIHKEFNNLKSMSLEERIEKFGDGSCYVYHSLPFAYSFFFKNHQSVDCITSTIEGGGDTDTNAKIVGEMFGALWGLDVIRNQAGWMIDGLKDYNDLLDLGNQFCDVLEIK